jgi:hypothetical protein
VDQHLGLFVPSGGNKEERQQQVKKSEGKRKRNLNFRNCDQPGVPEGIQSLSHPLCRVL